MKHDHSNMSHADLAQYWADRAKREAKIAITLAVLAIICGTVSIILVFA